MIRSDGKSANSASFRFATGVEELDTYDGLVIDPYLGATGTTAADVGVAGLGLSSGEEAGCALIIFVSNVMNSKCEPRTAEVGILLREAFPSVAERSDLRPLTHEECVSMRSELPSLSDRDLPFYIRQVLEDLLDTRTGQVGNTEDAHAVIRWLDVPHGGIDLKIIEEIYGKDGLRRHLEDEEFLKHAGRQAFASFTIKQANAISKWLELAKMWPEMKWYDEEIDSALTYWRARAGYAA